MTITSNPVSQLTSEIEKIDASIKQLSRRRRTLKSQLNRASIEFKREQTMTLAIELASAIREKNTQRANELAVKIASLNETKSPSSAPAKTTAPAPATKPAGSVASVKPPVQAPFRPAEPTK